MSDLDLALCQSKTVEIENTDDFIIGENSDFYEVHLSENGLLEAEYTNHTTYSTGSGTYYGKEYQKGIFIETFIK